MVSFMTWATLLPGKEPPVPIVQEAGWAPELVCTQWWDQVQKPSNSNGNVHTIQAGCDFSESGQLSHILLYVHSTAMLKIQFTVH